MPDSQFLYGGVNAFQRYSEGAQTTVGLGVDGSLKTSNSLPRHYELAKAGRIYTWNSATATGKAPVTAMPTTAAIFALWNGSPAGLGAVALLILGVAKFQISGTAGLGAAVIGGVSRTTQSAVTSATNAIQASTSGSARVSLATFGTDITLASNPGWMVLGGSDQPAAAQVGAGTFTKLDGEYLVQPGQCFGMSVLSPVGTTALYGMAVMYAEVEAYCA